MSASATREPSPGATETDDLAMGRASVAVARALVLHPELWPAAVAEMTRLARPGWWRQLPPLPVPSAELWRFRMVTAYGGAGDGVPEVADVVSFLRWCRDMRRWRRE
jgi:hypothetical protein